MSNIKLTINAEKRNESLGDFYGIFFEDLNHAADGGLYGELIQNRSFEYNVIDHPTYHPLMAWELVSDPLSRVEMNVSYGKGIHENNPHYLVLDVFEINKEAGVLNTGYNPGIAIKEESYNFSVFAGCDGRPVTLEVSLEDTEGHSFAKGQIHITSKEWTKHQLVLVSNGACNEGRLVIRALNPGRIYLDMVSLFPVNTFLKRENGLRNDIAQLLKDLKPRFLRFPGGCLVHDGSINSDDRDSMYRWKNTIGPVEQRPTRRNNWRYNQTLGLGYYEYFTLCEDIGAKPLPVLPAGYDPHHQRMVPFEQLGEWVDDALDLIEFATGDVNSVWGKIRCELGHPEPFNLEYIGIGNEEVGDGFFDRYPYFHKAIKEKYPEIKIINSSGPFSAGGEYDRGWKSAKEHKSDLVDEHYYSSPEWFIANHHHYDNFKQEEPKVFLGEYASWGNTWYNALAEASYMIGLEKNAHAVGLACYAPLLCNVDYINWQPDMIWFNNHQAYGTANYYVQKLFMNHQGDTKVEVVSENLPETVTKESTMGHMVELPRVFDTDVKYTDIKITNLDNNAVISYDDLTIMRDGEGKVLDEIPYTNYKISFKGQKLGGRRGFLLHFNKKDDRNKLSFEFGGWQNLDSIITEDINGRNTCLTQSMKSVTSLQTYQLDVVVKGKKIEAYIDGVLENHANSTVVELEPLYYTTSVEDTTGDIILKVVNLREVEMTTDITLEGVKVEKATVYSMAGYDLDAKNSFEEPTLIQPKESTIEISNDKVSYTFPKESITIIRFLNTRV